jgi:hypothetical protein
MTKANIQTRGMLFILHLGAVLREQTLSHLKKTEFNQEINPRFSIQPIRITSFGHMCQCMLQLTKQKQFDSVLSRK